MNENVYRPERRKYFLKSIYNLRLIVLLDIIFFGIRSLVSLASGNPIGITAVYFNVIGLVLFGIIYIVIRQIGYNRVFYTITDESIDISHWSWLKSKTISISDIHSIEYRRSTTDKRLNVGAIRIHVDDPKEIIYDGQNQTYTQLESLCEYQKFQSQINK